MKQSVRNFLVLGLICAVGLVVYVNSWNTSFHFDDQTSIVGNFSIHRLDNLGAIWNFWPTRFFTYLSFALNYHAHQLHVTGYHIVNTLIHMAASLCVWWLARLTWVAVGRRNDEETGFLTALFAGLIFAAHPIQTQAVTYITQRAASLAGLLFLAALCSYIRSRQAAVSSQRTATRYYVLSLFLAVCAMFTKETAVTLPLALLLYEELFLSPGAKKPWRSLVPFFVIACTVPLVMLGSHSVDFAGLHRAGEPAPGMTPWAYAMTQMRVLVTYLRLLCVPAFQNLDYDYPVYSSWFNPPVFFSFIFLLGLAVAAWRIRRRLPVLAFGIFWFFVTLAPESSFLPIRDVIFEHRLYLPAAGFALCLPWMFLAVAPVRHRRWPVIGLMVVVLMFMVLSVRRNLVWKDETTLAEDILRRSPHKARAYKTLGYEHERRGDIAGALALYQKALSIDPGYAEVYYNRANILAGQGSYDAAVGEYDLAIRFYPAYALAYHNRGLAYALKGDLKSALKDLDRAVELGFRAPVIYRNRARVFVGLRAFDRGMKDYDEAIMLDPDDAAAFVGRGTLCAAMGRFDQALSDFGRAIELEPESAEAYNSRSLVYALKGDMVRAAEDKQKVQALEVAGVKP